MRSDFIQRESRSQLGVTRIQRVHQGDRVHAADSRRSKRASQSLGTSQTSYSTPVTSLHMIPEIRHLAHYRQILTSSSWRLSAPHPGRAAPHLIAMVGMPESLSLGYCALTSNVIRSTDLQPRDRASPENLAAALSARCRILNLYCLVTGRHRKPRV